MSSVNKTSGTPKAVTKRSSTSGRSGSKKAGTKKAGTKKAGTKKAATKKAGTRKVPDTKSVGRKAGGKKAAGKATTTKKSTKSAPAKKSTRTTGTSAKGRPSTERGRATSETTARTASSSDLPRKARSTSGTRVAEDVVVPLVDSGWDGPDAATVDASPESTATDPFGSEWEDEDLWGTDWDDLEQHGDSEPEASDRARSGRDRGPDGMEVFQTAALELIGAARNALDAAEELVADPHAIGTAFESVRGIATEVLRTASAVGRHAATDNGAAEGDDDDQGFQHIRVSDD